MPTFLLMEKEVIIEQVKNAVTPVLEEMGIELVDLTFRKEGGRLMLRLLADKEGVSVPSFKSSSRW